MAHTHNSTIAILGNLPGNETASEFWAHTVSGICSVGSLIAIREAGGSFVVFVPLLDTALDEAEQWGSETRTNTAKADIKFWRWMCALVGGVVAAAFCGAKLACKVWVWDELFVLLGAAVVWLWKTRLAWFKWQEAEVVAAPERAEAKDRKAAANLVEQDEKEKKKEAKKAEKAEKAEKQAQKEAQQKKAREARRKRRQNTESGR